MSPLYLQLRRLPAFLRQQRYHHRVSTRFVFHHPMINCCTSLVRIRRGFTLPLSSLGFLLKTLDVRLYPFLLRFNCSKYAHLSPFLPSARNKFTLSRTNTVGGLGNAIVFHQRAPCFTSKAQSSACAEPSGIREDFLVAMASKLAQIVFWRVDTTTPKYRALPAKPARRTLPVLRDLTPFPSEHDAPA